MQTTSFSARIPIDVAVWLEKRRKAAGVTTSKIVADLLGEAMRKEKRKLSY